MKRSPPLTLLISPLTLLILILAGAASCGDPGGSAPGGPAASGLSEVRDSAGIVIQEFSREAAHAPSALRLASQPSVRMGRLEGDAAYLWTRPSAGARLSDGSFVVAEMAPAELRIFDAQGAFLRRVSQPGDGPGELRQPTAVTVLPGDTLLVWDAGPQRLTWFTAQGEFVRDARLVQPGGIVVVRRVAPAPDGTVYLLGSSALPESFGNRGRMREEWDVVAVHPSGAVGGSLGRVPGREQEIRVDSRGGEIVSVSLRGWWWWGEGFAWASPQGVWTADRLVPEARHFGMAGLDRIVRIAHDPREITPALVDSIHRVELDRARDPDLRRAMEGGLQEREYSRWMPPLEAVFADVQGRLWLGRLDPPPMRIPSQLLPAVKRWWVLTPGASPEMAMRLEEAELPPLSHPLWADAGGILLLRAEPEFDVAIVEWYAFQSD